MRTHDRPITVEILVGGLYFISVLSYTCYEGRIVRTLVVMRSHIDKRSHLQWDEALRVFPFYVTHPSLSPSITFPISSLHGSSFAVKGHHACNI